MFILLRIETKSLPRHMFPSRCCWCHYPVNDFVGAFVSIFLPHLNKYHTITTWFKLGKAFLCKTMKKKDSLLAKHTPIHEKEMWNKSLCRRQPQCPKVILQCTRNWRIRYLFFYKTKFNLHPKIKIFREQNDKYKTWSCHYLINKSHQKQNIWDNQMKVNISPWRSILY